MPIYKHRQETIIKTPNLTASKYIACLQVNAKSNKPDKHTSCIKQKNIGN